jgi:hypothetical protein
MGNWGAHHCSENDYSPDGELIKRIGDRGPTGTDFIMENGDLTLLYHDIYGGPDAPECNSQHGHRI